ncbi:Gti1/Pac2 family-domain-containing protein [Epithele typhae]|uniref:Gti1/Pac2 family-domain-containing protein n=1 Tax=Epithele typhae TaxID=378194 RepID=UPI002007F5E0|nr:Gti1/Pac2 family-domain-containing protein [Epithele typhae]KAH9929589.1 Gti1/Pac2 family-domain-containing protein [Epithele typhae]
MQRPTLTHVHIRHAADAHKLFYAVQLGLLPKIEKRLDANERAALRPGDVYVWEEKGPNSDSFSVSMERFTEGKSWTASRVREDFLMYFESPRKGKGNARTSENQVVRPGEQDLYIKLTYSVIREDVGRDAGNSKDAEDKQKKPPKWHMNAYFTKLTEGQLRTIDEIPMLRELTVPDNIFRSARTTKPNKRSEGSRNATSTVKRMYAPFPPHPSRRLHETPPPGSLMSGPSMASSSAIPLSGVPEVFPPPPASIPLHPSIHPAPPFYPELPQQSSSLASALSPPIHMFSPQEQKPALTPVVSSLPSFSASLSLSHPSPLYGWANNADSSGTGNPVRGHSPASSERSVQSFRSVHLSPSLSSASTSSLDSPIMAQTPPLWDNGEPYQPAPQLPTASSNPIGVDLAPLETLPRNNPYRRSSVDDRALRLLASGGH